MNFREFLAEKADIASASAKALRREHPDSWGAAYECGYVVALQYVLLQLPKAAGDIEQ